MARHSLRIAPFLSALLLAAAFVAGCGGGGDSDSTSSLTKAQFIKQGDAICTKADNQQMARLVEWDEDHPQEELRTKSGEEATIRAVFLPTLETQIDALVALGTPSEDGELMEQFVNGLEETAAAVDKDPLGLQAYEREIVKPMTAAASKYGFKVCSLA